MSLFSGQFQRSFFIWIHPFCRISIWWSIFFVESTQLLRFLFPVVCFSVYISFVWKFTSFDSCHQCGTHFFGFYLYSYVFDLASTNLVCLSFHDYGSICTCTYTIFVSTIKHQMGNHIPGGWNILTRYIYKIHDINSFHLE